jgi:hypothetical protein
MNYPASILIGFFPKITHRNDDWFENPIVEEICSVSNCISSCPIDWINLWMHNDSSWLYDTENIVQDVIDLAGQEMDVYAYKLLPVVFDGDKEIPFTIESSASGSLEQFDFLGYDMVSRSRNESYEPWPLSYNNVIDSFEHSPLSCNQGCKDYRVNKFCLIDQLEDAWRITKEIAADSKNKKTWEPGRYYLLEVYRRQKPLPAQ